MALTTYSALKTEIIEWSKRSDLDLKVPTFITLAEAEMLSNPIAILRAAEYEVRATATLSTSSRYLDLPTDFKSMRRLRIDTDSGFCLLQYRSPEQLESYDGPDIPRFFTITSQIEFDTVPDDTYTLEMQYNGKLVALSDGAPTNAVLTRYPHLYLYGALMQVYRYTEEPDMEAKFADLFYSSIKGANKDADAGRFGPALVMRSRGYKP